MSYSTGIFDCMMDTTSCIEHICCMPCQIGRQCNAADLQNPERDNMSFLYCLIGWFAPNISACCIRRNIAQKYNLEEGCCVSAILAIFCVSCSLCQTHRELTAHKMWPGGVCCHKQPGEFGNAPIR